MNAHPAAELFPMMSDAELVGLIDDIREHGLLDEIVTHDGLILDGRNRFRACELTGVEPRFREYVGDEPVSFVVSTNLVRRQLSPSQQAAVAVDAEEMLAVEAKERQREAGRLYGVSHPKEKVVIERAQPLRSRDLAAKKFGVATAQVGRAKALKTNAPDIFHQVQLGNLTIGAALKRAGLNHNGATNGSRHISPQRRHDELIKRASAVVSVGERWQREMTDALSPLQARRQLTVLRKTRDLLDDVIEAVEYRAATLKTFDR